MIAIRPMQAADAARVSDLSGQLGHPATPAEIAERFQALTQRTDQAVLVACDDEGQVIGWMHLLNAGYLHNRPYAEIGGLVVDEAHRSKGVGEAFVVASEEWARQRGLSEIRLRSNAKRLRAHAFYQRLGFVLTKQSLQFSKEIPLDNSCDNR